MKNPIGQILQKQAHHPTHKIALFFPVKRADYVQGTFSSTENFECPGDVLAMVTTLWTWPSESKNEAIKWLDRIQDKVGYLTQLQRRWLAYLLSFPGFFERSGRVPSIELIKPEKYSDAKPLFAKENLNNIWEKYSNERDAPRIM